MFPRDVSGYMSPQECAELYRIACETPEDGTIVELGALFGRSAIAMAQSGRTVWAVDRFLPEHGVANLLPEHEAGEHSADAVRLNAARYGVDVRVIEGDTAAAGAAWREPWEHRPIHLLHVDAGHEYESVKADWLAWSPHLATGAVAVFDDSTWPGVSRLLLELRDWEPVSGPQVGGLTAMRWRQ